MKKILKQNEYLNLNNIFNICKSVRDSSYIFKNADKPEQLHVRI